MFNKRFTLIEVLIGIVIILIIISIAGPNISTFSSNNKEKTFWKITMLENPNLEWISEEKPNLSWCYGGWAKIIKKDGKCLYVKSEVFIEEIIEDQQNDK